MVTRVQRLYFFLSLLLICKTFLHILLLTFSSHFFHICFTLISYFMLCCALSHFCKRSHVISFAHFVVNLNTFCFTCYVTFLYLYHFLSYFHLYIPFLINCYVLPFKPSAHESDSFSVQSLNIFIFHISHVYSGILQHSTLSNTVSDLWNNM